MQTPPTPSPQAAPVWGEPLLHPVCLLGMAVWWFNDHVGKVYAPSALTGKASDVACLVVFPVWTWCLADGIGCVLWPNGYRQNLQRRLWCLYALTGAICLWFTLINVSEFMGAVHRDLWSAIYAVLRRPLSHLGASWSAQASHTVDAADLFTLPAAALGVWIGRAAIRAEAGRSAQ
jgi:hypothetical protein